MSTTSLKQRVIDIDNQAKKILAQGGEESLLISMHDMMGDLKQIMDKSTHSELDEFCEQYSGFYRCMKFLELLAKGISDGTIPVIPSEETVRQRNRVRQHDYDLNPEWVVRYEHIRNTMRDLHGKFIVSLPRDGVDRCAKRLEISGKNGALHLNTEHEMNLFFDYCLFQYHQDNSNFIQKAFKQYQGKDTEILSIFKAAANGYFAYLQIIESIGDAGLIVFDLE